MGDNNMSFVIIVFELRQKIVGGECMGLVGWIKTNILRRDTVIQLFCTSSFFFTKY